MDNAINSLRYTIEAIDTLKLAIEQRGYALPDELVRLNTLANLLFTEARWVTVAAEKAEKRNGAA